jgi:hypothetical protein
MAFADLGEQAVKNIARRSACYLQGHRGDSGRLDPAVGGRRGGVVGRPVRAGNHFCQTGDGVQLAYARMGQVFRWSKPANLC